MQILISNARKYKRCYSVNIFTVLYIIGTLLANISCDTDNNNLSPDNKYPLTLKVQPEGAGTVSGDGEYEAGEEVSIKVESDSGYKFVFWRDDSDNLISESAEFNYIMPGYDVALTAKFVELTDYEIHFIDVGQGDAILITTDEKVLLVDAGRNDAIAVEYLSDMEIDKINIVIATHPHADHIGGFLDIFYEFEIGEVIDPGVTQTSQTYRDYLEAIDVNDIPYTEGRKGMVRDLGEGAHLEILHPPEPIPDYDNSYLNNVSVVAKVTFGEISVLLTGDIESVAESDVLAYPDKLASTILKVGHHGSKTSSSESFLQAVQPEVSVIMCGEDNPFNHPSEDVLERLNDIGTEIYRTDQHGTIIITTDSHGYEVFKESDFLP